MERIFPGEFKEAHYFVMTWNNLLGRGFLVHCGIVLFCWGFFQETDLISNIKDRPKLLLTKQAQSKWAAIFHFLEGFPHQLNQMLQNAVIEITRLLIARLFLSHILHMPTAVLLIHGTLKISICSWLSTMRRSALNLKRAAVTVLSRYGCHHNGRQQ